jgi:hypothetical protein
MDFNKAFQINHVQPGTYGGTIVYDQTCPFCSFPESKGLMNDGGSFRECRRCKKQFRANIMGGTVANYTTATSHLNPNNSNLLVNNGFQSILPTTISGSYNKSKSGSSIYNNSKSNSFTCGICNTIQDYRPSRDKFSNIQWCISCKKMTFKGL